MLITAHARKRVQSRARVKADMVSKVVERAFKRGLRHNQTYGDLKKLVILLENMFKTIRLSRTYGKINAI